MGRTGCRIFVGLAFVGLIYSNVAFSQIESGQSRGIDLQKCKQSKVTDPVVRRDDLPWGVTSAELEQNFLKMYASKKRLKNRVFWNQSLQRFQVNMVDYQGTVTEVVIPPNFINNVTQHIEEGLKRGYAQAIYFADMGHNHFLIPQKFYDEELKGINGLGNTIEKMITHKGLKMVYHTAEQLKMRDDKNQLLTNSWLQWRYYTRNLVGWNDGSGRLEIHKNLKEGYNTVRSEKNYRWWGAGFYIHAAKDGCFPYRKDGKTFYFDLNIDGLHSDL